MDTANQKARVSALLTRARADRALGAPGAAAAGLSEAAAAARTMGRRRQLVAVLSEWAEVLAESGDLRGAYERSREALALGSSAAPVVVPAATADQLAG